VDEAIAGVDSLLKRSFECHSKEVILQEVEQSVELASIGSSTTTANNCIYHGSSAASSIAITQ
jgi:hypothetical protein